MTAMGGAAGPRTLSGIVQEARQGKQAMASGRRRQPAGRRRERSGRRLPIVTAGMLDVMETPAHERRHMEEYLRSQSGDGFEIEHVEKLTSEYVLGHRYDVWDAHTMRHVTLLSTYNGARAPSEIDIEPWRARRCPLRSDRPQALAFDDVAAIIAAVSGQPVGYRDINEDARISAAIAAGLPADYAAMLRWLTGAIISGDGSLPSGDVETVTGRPSASFEAFARRDAAAWTTPEDK